MSGVVSAVLALIQILLPNIGTASVVGKVIEAMVQIIPFLVQEYKDLLPMARNIIAALSTNPATTAEQLATLQALDAQCDQAFEAAASNALAEDAAGQP